METPQPLGTGFLQPPAPQRRARVQEAAAAAATGARDVQSHRYAGFDDGDDDEEPAPAPDLADEEDEAGQHISAASLVRCALTC